MATQTQRHRPLVLLMRICPQRLLKLHINMFMMDQLHIDMQSDSKKRKGSDRTARSDQIRSDRQIGPIQFGPPKEIPITLDSRKIWRPMITRWKAYEVYFPTQQVSCHFDFPIRIYGRIIEDWTEGQESARGFILLKFPCMTVPFYNVSWCMPHMPGNLIKSSFTPNKRLIVLTSE